MKYARIVDNKVWEVFTPPVGVDIFDCFTFEIAEQFKSCPAEVEQNWLVVDGKFVQPADQVIIEG
jgi:hypothetical protein